MQDLDFYNLYNTFDCKINNENPIKTLKIINLLFCKLGLRIDEKEVCLIENKIFNMYKYNRDKNDIESIIDCISTIQLHQPFFDGNHRTSLLFFKMVMKELVPNFKYQASGKENEFNIFFNIYYHDDDRPSENKVKNICRYIKKSN